ncbi:MAG: hypothetical protein ACREHD_22605, partial [Pirellulales bacterium]
ATGNHSRDRAAYRSLVVMAELIRGINAAKACSHSKLRQALRRILLPRRSVQKLRNANACHHQDVVRHNHLSSITALYHGTREAQSFLRLLRVNLLGISGSDKEFVPVPGLKQENWLVP